MSVAYNFNVFSVQCSGSVNCSFVFYGHDIQLQTLLLTGKNSLLRKTQG